MPGPTSTSRRAAARELRPGSVGPGRPPGPAPANQQLTYAHNTPYLFDQTVSVAGNWSVDARSSLGRAFDDVLNEICDVGTPPPANSPCEFTQTGPLFWGNGAPESGGATYNCAAATPDWQPVLSNITYSADQEASLTAGGGLSSSTEGSLFGIVSTTVTVDVEAQHEWTKGTGFSRTATAYIPPQNSGIIWTVPVIGTVTGTLVVTDGRGDVHRHQLQRDPQWGDKGQRDAGVRRHRAHPADEPRDVAGEVQRCVLEPRGDRVGRRQGQARRCSPAEVLDG